MTICMLGRQPELGLAELETLYGADHVRPVGRTCALVDGPVDFKRLGGSIKAARLIATISSIERKQIFKQVAKILPSTVKELPSEGKIKLGLSIYGFDISPYDLNGEALRLKKVIRSAGRSVRVVPNETPALSSAQTYHNSLAGELGMELVIVRDATKTLVGRVTHTQDIDSYRVRDRERPKRDAFVGMLPPKLAQIIVNLSAGKLEDSPLNVHQKVSVAVAPTSKFQRPTSILDPFCGTGVILQEALLMGYNVYGSDKSAKMFDYTKANLTWLAEGRHLVIDDKAVKLAVADATDYTWDLSDVQGLSSTVHIATETYLGQPLGGQHPTPEKLAGIVHESNDIVKRFLKNISSQLASGTRLCVAVPAWFVNELPTRLPVVDELESLGFIQQDFTHATAPLIYHRDNQITGRELLVLTKK